MSLHTLLRTPVRAALAALTVVAVISVPALVAAHPSDSNPSAEREKVRAQRAEVAGQVNALEADQARLEEALAALEANVRGQEALLAEAQRAAAEAREAAEQARAAEAAAVERIAVLEEKVRDLAVDAFIHPPSDDVYDALEAESLNDHAQRKALLELQSDRDADLLDQLEAAREDREIQRQNAEAASKRADEKEAEVADRLTKLREARDQQRRFAAQVEERLEAKLAESAALAARDAELSREIAAEQARLAAQIRARAASGGGGRISVGNVTVTTVSCPDGGSIVVATSIAGNVQSLLNAADSAGVDGLCGWGYRDSSAQIALRKKNGCPDVYSAPPSSCATPTARPGASMHERGLAIDFTQNGSVLSSSSSGYSWLKGNAASYGLYNLPSEPWHWSTNGN